MPHAQHHQSEAASGALVNQGQGHAAALRRIKALHTVVWVFFVAAILGSPLAAYLGRFRLSALLTGVVALEVLVLVANRLRCPLTDVAARYTEDRRDNFDIYLPEWLARHNKSIFGTLYVLGVIASGAWWLGWLSR